MVKKAVCIIVGLLMLYPVWVFGGTRGARPFKVIIDPGHGGNDPGALSISGIREKDVVLKIAFYAAKMLRRWGVNTIMTRYTDETMSLGERARIVNYQRPDMFISLHANISRNRSVNGFESYIYDRNNRRGKLLFRTRDVDPFQFVFPMTFANRSKIFKDVQLAYFVHRKFKDHTGARDLGIKAAHFYVIKHIKNPSMLFEVGFLSNYREAAKLADSSYQSRMAKSIAEGIVLAMYGEDENVNSMFARKYRGDDDEDYDLPKSFSKKRTFRFPFAFIRGVN